MLNDPFGDLRDLYQEVILDHGKHPRNFRHPANTTHEARGDNPLCGDRITVFLMLDVDKSSGDRRVVDVAFDGRGCAISTASASLMTEVVKGKTEPAARALFSCFHDMCTKEAPDPHAHGPVDEEALDRLAVLAGVREFPVRVKCATLPWHTLVAALAGENKTSTE
ncbi:MAG: SUF system NifU family Fe-S cluster assembly protein [Rhodospirillaceae bacterium]